MDSLGVVLLDSLFTRFLENVMRKEEERSASVLDREQKRTKSFLDALETLVRDEEEPITLGTIMVMTGLGAAAGLPGAVEGWRAGRANLATYYDRCMSRPAFQETAPNFG